MACLRRAIDWEVVDRRRKIGKRLVTCDEQTFEALAKRSGNPPSAEDLAIEGEEHLEMVRTVRRLHAAIRELPPKLREVVEHRCLGDGTPTFAEIGAKLGISEDAAKKRWERARAHLRKIFGRGANRP